MTKMRLEERKPIRKIVDGKLFCIPCNTKVESQHHFAANHDPRILKCEECGVETGGFFLCDDCEEEVYERDNHEEDEE